MAPKYRSTLHIWIEPYRTPTVVPAENFNPTLDGQNLRKAMKGFGCNDDQLIEILTKRSNAQRQDIANTYKSQFGRDLISDIKSETSGNFKQLLVSLLIPTIDFYCEQIRSAIEGVGTDEELLIEFLCGLQNTAIHKINEHYRYKYGVTLENEIKSDTSGHFKRLFVSLLVGGRDENVPVDPKKALEDAEALLRAGELKIGTDESTFNMIFCRRSYAHLREVDNQYRTLVGHPLETALEKEFSGDVKDGLKAIVRCAIDRQDFFARRLHKSMAGIGTNDDQLIRIIIVRSELDMEDIKVAFQKRYGKSLKDWIKGDTSGSYRKCLLSLIREEK